MVIVTWVIGDGDGDGDGVNILMLLGKPDEGPTFLRHLSPSLSCRELSSPSGTSTAQFLQQVEWLKSERYWRWIFGNIWGNFWKEIHLNLHL